MSAKRQILWAAVLLAAVAPASADTLYFRDGTTVRGVVLSDYGGSVVLGVGSGRMRFSREEIARIERDGNTGQTVKAAEQAAGKTNEEQADPLFKRTGMTREERDMVRDAIEPLWSPDEAERGSARKRLVDMAKRLPLFQFIESSLPYSKGALVPELMTVLFQIDPEQARNVLGQRCTDPDPAARGKALDLMASYEKDKDIETIARGTVDPDRSVRLGAVTALARAADKRSTPVLVACLGSRDVQVRNAALTGLQRMWNRDVSTRQEWESFWDTKSKATQGALDPSTLAPLVSKEELEKAAPGYDE